eukprot:73738-Rhodomonas_salina.1
MHNVALPRVLRHVCYNFKAEYPPGNWIWPPLAGVPGTRVPGRAADDGAVSACEEARQSRAKGGEGRASQQ